MAKLEKPSSRSSAAPHHRPGAAERAAAEERSGRIDPPAPAGGVSLAMRLAAEVDALKAELAAARAQAHALETRADTDGLTEILNRRGFERELARSLAYVKRYGTAAALVYLDLDRFKPVNDTFGHTAGDAVLRAVTATLARAVRASDVVARIGGDELAVLLWNVTPEAAAAKAVVLEEMIAGTLVPWEAEFLSVGASAGAVMLEPSDDCPRVLARADRAMYARKRARRAAG